MLTNKIHKHFNNEYVKNIDIKIMFLFHLKLLQYFTIQMFVI